MQEAYGGWMSKVIQVRGVPDDVHAKLVAAAQAEGKSLTQYLAGELETIARRADVQWHNAQVIADLRAKYGPADDDGGVDTAELIRQMREERTASIERAMAESDGRRRAATRK